VCNQPVRAEIRGAKRHSGRRGENDPAQDDPRRDRRTRAAARCRGESDEHDGGTGNRGDEEGADILPFAAD